MAGILNVLLSFINPFLKSKYMIFAAAAGIGIYFLSKALKTSTDNKTAATKTGGDIAEMSKSQISVMGIAGVFAETLGTDKNFSWGQKLLAFTNINYFSYSKLLNLVIDYGMFWQEIEENYKSFTDNGILMDDIQAFVDAETYTEILTYIQMYNE